MAILKSLGTGDVLGGRYRIISTLGQGGMGAVYLAEDLKLKRKMWAVKAILIAPGEETSMALEAEMLVSLQHPQMPHIVDYFLPDENGLAYMVMDYVQGPTLQDAFERSGRKFPDTDIIGYAVQMCDLLHYLHTYKPRPIVYRDLKPSNVMIDESGSLRLIDFGIARHYKYGQHADTVRIGTIGFAAPEQIAGEQTDPRSDLYALGALMYFLLTQGRMYYMTSAPLSELRPDLPASLTHTVHRLLEEDVQQRVQSAQEAKERLLSIGDALKTDGGVRPGSILQNHRTAQIAALDQPSQSKLVIVGGLYPGVGSTFVAVTLARMLHACGIANCLIEHPQIEPDLYMLLYGDKFAPSGYRFAAETILSDTGERGGDHLSKSTAWTDGWTTWIPCNPDGMHGEWSIAQTFKLLHRVRQSVTIWDVSTAWEDPSVAELCRAADHVFVVADASPAKLNRPAVRKRMQELSGADWIANRETQLQGRKDWHHAMPKPPVCRLPELPREAIIGSMWKGYCIQDDPGLQNQLFHAMKPLMRNLIPEGTQIQQPVRRKHSIWSRLLRDVR